MNNFPSGQIGEKFISKLSELKGWKWKIGDASKIYYRWCGGEMLIDALCDSDTKTLWLDRNFVKTASIEKLTMTKIHELSHVVCSVHGHGKEWYLCYGILSDLYLRGILNTFMTNKGLKAFSKVHKK